MSSFQFNIEGRVQYVGFRFFVLEKANEFQISGFVKNLRDHSVFVEAHGNDIQMLKFISEIQKGPTSARITHFGISDIPYKLFDNFTIDR